MESMHTIEMINNSGNNGITSMEKNMKQETRQKLLNFYREHNEKFFVTIGKRFDWEI